MKTLTDEQRAKLQEARDELHYCDWDNVMSAIRRAMDLLDQLLKEVPKAT